MAVVDASVLAALFIPKDSHRLSALNWYKEALLRGESLRAPALVLVEVASAIARATATPPGDLRLVARALEQIRADFAIYPLTEDRALESASVAAVCGVRGADAVYLALAQELRDVLVSMDKQQVERGGLVVTTQRP